MANDDAKIIDFKQFIELAGNNEESAVEMAEMFIEHAPEYYEEIVTSYNNYDNSEWHDTTHKVKGMASFSGATRLYKICEIAQSRYTAPDSEKQKMLTIINNEIQQAADTLKRYIETREVT